jgi:hypothetical protein
MKVLLLSVLLVVMIVSYAVMQLLLGVCAGWNGGLSHCCLPDWIYGVFFPRKQKNVLGT